MYRVPLSESRPTSCTTTIPGWLSRAAMRASEKKRSSNGSFSPGGAGRIVFKAMTRERAGSRAS
jgi:hypothetical protein